MILKRNLPIIFLAVLLILISFLGGTRYGKYVERKSSSNLNLFPTIKVEESKKDEYHNTNYSFLLHQNENCKIELLYPDYLIVSESSDSASFLSNKNEEMIFSCSKNINVDKVFTKKILFQGKQTDVEITENPNPLYVFIIDHPKTKNKIEFRISPKFLSLVDRTLSYELSQ